MDVAAYLAYLSRFHLPATEVDLCIDDVLALERWLKKRDVTLETVTVRDIRVYLKRLVRRDENSIDDLLSLLFYYEYSDRVDLDIYLNDVIQGALNLEEIYDRVRQRFGFDVSYHLEHNVPQPPLGTDPMRLPQYTARLVRRLLADLPKRDVLRVLSNENELILPIQYETERALYQAANSLDEYLLASAKLELLKFRSLQRREFKWKSVYVSEEYLNRIAAFQEMLSGIRRGNRLYITLQPYLPEYYLQASTPEQRRYYACKDPDVRSSFLVGKPSIPVIWCERCVEHCRQKFEYLLGRPLSAELVESALLGDTSCRIAVLLGPDGANEPDETVE